MSSSCSPLNPNKHFFDDILQLTASGNQSLQTEMFTKKSQSSLDDSLGSHFLRILRQCKKFCYFVQYYVMGVIIQPSGCGPTNGFFSFKELPYFLFCCPCSHIKLAHYLAQHLPISQ